MDVVEELKMNLVPRGTLNVVSLQINNRFFNKDFVDDCIDDIGKKLVLNGSAFGELNSLEKLATYVLLDSANIIL